MTGWSRLLGALAAVVLGAVIVGAAAATPAGRTATFRVSFYGIQRYTSTTTSRENPASGCFDVQQRGSETGSTVGRFESSHPSHLVITTSPGLPDFAYRTSGQDIMFPLPAKAHWQTGGSTAYELSSCVGGSREWHAAPQPKHACGSASIPDTGGSLRPESPSTLLFAGGRDLVSLVDPLAGCAYGEHQYGLYEARGRYSPADLLNTRYGKHVVILRGHSRETTPFNDRGGIGTHIVETRTTVYVTFSRVR